jgi:preprotein translocase subunit SecF
VMFRFEWRFALASVIALIHDVLITLGFFSIFGVEFSLPVLAALLAVIGYSLNDTIVVFDRIRENFRTLMEASTEQVIERAINQTLPRTILTSVTTMLVLLSLYFYGGEVLAGLSRAMIVGVIIGTYSSVFIASPAVYSLGVSREDLLPPEKDDQTVEGELLP